MTPTQIVAALVLAKDGKFAEAAAVLSGESSADVTLHNAMELVIGKPKELYAFRNSPAEQERKRQEAQEAAKVRELEIQRLKDNQIALQKQAAIARARAERETANAAQRAAELRAEAERFEKIAKGGK